jgi:hypothetical protein
MTVLHVWNENIFICEKVVVSGALKTGLIQFEIHKMNEVFVCVCVKVLQINYLHFHIARNWICGVHNNSYGKDIFNHEEQVDQTGI